MSSSRASQPSACDPIPYPDTQFDYHLMTFAFNTNIVAPLTTGQLDFVVMLMPVEPHTQELCLYWNCSDEALVTSPDRWLQASKKPQQPRKPHSWPRENVDPTFRSFVARRPGKIVQELTILAETGSCFDQLIANHLPNRKLCTSGIRLLRNLPYSSTDSSSLAARLLITQGASRIGGVWDQRDVGCHEGNGIVCVAGHSRAVNGVSWPRYFLPRHIQLGGWAPVCPYKRRWAPKETATGPGHSGRPDRSKGNCRAGGHNCAASYAVAGTGFGTDAHRY